MLTEESIQGIIRRLYKINKLIYKRGHFIGFSSSVLEEITKNLNLTHEISNLKTNGDTEVDGEEYYSDPYGNVISFGWKTLYLEEAGVYAFEYPPKAEIYDGEIWETIDITPLLKLYVEKEDKVIKRVKNEIEEFLHPIYII